MTYSSLSKGSLTLGVHLSPDVFRNRVRMWTDQLGSRLIKQEKVLLSVREKKTELTISLARNGLSASCSGDCMTLLGRTSLLRWLEALDATLYIFKRDKKK